MAKAHSTAPTAPNRRRNRCRPLFERSLIDWTHTKHRRSRDAKQAHLPRRPRRSTPWPASRRRVMTGSRWIYVTSPARAKSPIPTTSRAYASVLDSTVRSLESEAKGQLHSKSAEPSVRVATLEQAAQPAGWPRSGGAFLLGYP